MTGRISTVASNGETAFVGDGGPDTEASINSPHDARVGPHKGDRSHLAGRQWH